LIDKQNVIMNNMKNKTKFFLYKSQEYLDVENYGKFYSICESLLEINYDEILLFVKFFTPYKYFISRMSISGKYFSYE